MNKLEATREWVNEFNAINASLIERAFKYNIDDWTELTPIITGNTVYYNDNYIDVLDVDYEKELVTLNLMDDDTDDYTVVSIHDIDYNFDNDWLPMWSTLWTFGSNLDEDWARKNPELVAKCGFRIFLDQETDDIYIGIDGAGYDFYEAHWVPLYEARGLQWHKED